MKIILTETQLKHIINETKREIDEDYPVSWDVEKFASLKSFNQRVKYCEENLTRISSGSARIVYKIDDNKVLKLAKNRKGIAQNLKEIDTSDDYYIKHLVAQVFHYDENGLWLEMELAKKVTKSMFKSIVGESFDTFYEYLNYEDSRIRINSYFRRPVPNNYEELLENEFFIEISDYMINYDVPVGDLTKLSSYGLVNRNGEDTIVLIDFGLDDNILKNYYGR